MTYRAHLPPGQAYNGQPPPMQQHGYPVHNHGDPQAHMPYQNAGYLPHSHVPPPQPQAHYHMSAQQHMEPQPLYSTWDGSYLGHGVPVPEPPDEFRFHPQNQWQQRPTPEGFNQYQAPLQPSPQPVPSPVLPQQMPPPPPHRASQERSIQQAPLIQSPVVDQGRRLTTDGSVKSTSGKLSRKSSSSSIGKSPKPSSASLVNAAALLVCTAEDCFSHAHAAVEQVAAAMDASRLQEYHKLIATGLACLEAALNTNKLQPRAEAKIRLRYGAILNEETENLMQAETALSKGITVCEKV